MTGETATAKGIRRIIAVTGNEARRATEEAERFAKKIDEIRTLEGKELNAAVIALSKEIDDGGEDSTLPLLSKEAFRKDLAELKKRFDDADKAQKAAKQEEAVRKFKEVAEANANIPFLVQVLDIGSNSKIAANAASFLPNSAVFILSVDEETQKIMYYSRVPKELNGKGLIAKDWCQELSQLLAGKSGGNEQTAQGVGSNIGGLEEAKKIATNYAKSKF